MISEILSITTLFLLYWLIKGCLFLKLIYGLDYWCNQLSLILESKSRISDYVVVLIEVTKSCIGIKNYYWCRLSNISNRKKNMISYLWKLEYYKPNGFIVNGNYLRVFLLNQKCLLVECQIGLQSHHLMNLVTQIVFGKMLLIMCVRAWGQLLLLTVSPIISYMSISDLNLRLKHRRMYVIFFLKTYREDGHVLLATF